MSKNNNLLSRFAGTKGNYSAVTIKSPVVKLVKEVFVLNIKLYSHCSMKCKIILAITDRKVAL